jgi:hypothetical protein
LGFDPPSATMNSKVTKTANKAALLGLTYKIFNKQDKTFIDEYFSGEKKDKEMNVTI